MKTIILIIAILTLATSIRAQYINDDYDRMTPSQRARYMVSIGGLGGVDTSFRLGSGPSRPQTAAEIAADKSFQEAQIKQMAVNEEKRKIVWQAEYERIQAKQEQERIQRQEKEYQEHIKLQKRLFEFRKEQAEKDMPSAQFNLGIMYLHGTGCEMNKELGMTYIQRAATNGCADAIEFVGKNK